MRNDKAGGSGKKRGASAVARIDLHPSASKAASGLMSAMAVEFDRWMADEVEGLAESISVVDGSESSPHVRAHLRQLAEQLARQADTLGYPDIVQVGQTLYNQTGQTFPIVIGWMGFFLLGSLILSYIVNYFNRRLKLVER